MAKERGEEKGGEERRGGEVRRRMQIDAAVEK
jgi:hypothetical protein